MNKVMNFLFDTKFNPVYTKTEKIIVPIILVIFLLSFCYLLWCYALKIFVMPNYVELLLVSEIDVNNVLKYIFNSNDIIDALTFTFLSYVALASFYIKAFDRKMKELESKSNDFDKGM